MTLSIVMHVFELFVRNINQSKVVSTVSDLIGCNEKKIPTATIVWWIPKIYTWNFVVNCLYPNNNGMLSTRGTTWRLTWHKCKGFRFSAPGCFNTKLQQKCRRSGVQFQTSSYWKGDEICQQSVLCWLQLMAASGNFARFPKLQENEGQMLVPNSPISLIHLIHEADLKY